MSAKTDVKNWNRLHKIGTKISYQSISDRKSTYDRISNTITNAYVALSGTPVVHIYGMLGYVSLNHVTELKECNK